MKTIMTKKTVRTTKLYRQPLGRRITAALMAMFMLLQICLPAVAAAMTIGDEKLSKLLAADLLFELSSSPKFQYQKAKYLGIEPVQQISTLESFHQRIKSANVALPGALSSQPIGKLVGDVYVQTRLIRAQINELLGRHLIDPARFASELLQANGLYDAAFIFAQNTPTAAFGQKPPEGTNLDMIWPEYRIINSERVLVPVVYLKTETIQARAVKGITNQFDGDAVFQDVIVAKDALLEQRSGFLAAMRNITNNGGTIQSSESLSLFARGTLSNISGKITAAENLEIIAGQIINKTVVVPYTFKNGSATRLGEIAEMNATNGSISLKSYSDILFEGGTATANNTITFDAARDIILRSTLTTSQSTGKDGHWEITSSSLDVAAQSKLTANETIKLIAGGTIQISGAELVSTQGGIELLASQGIYVLDELSQEQINKIDRKGKTTGQSSEFRTEAVRAVLKAGKGVLLDTEFGDVTLKAANIETVDGTQVTARNGKVNMLMTKELEEFHLQTVRKGTWTIKTKQVDIVNENNIANTIIGGFDVDAANGVNVEFTGEEPEANQNDNKFKAVKALVGGRLANALYSMDVEYKGVQETEEDTLKRQIDEYRNMPGMEWMATIYDQEWVDKNADPDAPSAPNTVNWKAVEEIHKEIRKSNTSLSPAAMAIVAIAVAVAMGPVSGLIGPGGGGVIGGMASNATLGAALNAGALTLVTQATQSLAAGNNLRETLNAMDSDESLKNLAISMATAGAMQHTDIDMFSKAAASDDLFVSLSGQAAQAVVNSTVSAGISVAINGGNTDDFNNAFKSALAMSAINSITESLAKKIGDAAKLPDDQRISVGAQYIAHAAVGCLRGSLSATINGDEVESSCYSGAGGAVIGEAVGQYFEKRLNDRVNSWVQEQLESDVIPNAEEMAKQYEIFRLSGVDLSKLSAAFAAFATGGNVDVAASAAENAAKNNALNVSMSLESFKQSINSIFTYLGDQATNDLAQLGRDAQLYTAWYHSEVESAYANGLISQADYYLELDRVSYMLEDAGVIPTTNGDYIFLGIGVATTLVGTKVSIKISGGKVIAQELNQIDFNIPSSPIKGAVTDANFAQKTIRTDEKFSGDASTNGGIQKYTQLAGRPINTIDDLVDALQKGDIRVDQIPVDYVIHNGQKLILNTRTSVALDRAGIPRSEWHGSDKTNLPVPGGDGKTFNDLAIDQLDKNKLPDTGWPEIPFNPKSK